MILEAIEALGVWSWWIVGLVMLAVELAVPGSFMLWFGVSALAVGVLSLLLDWPWQAQIIAFALLSLASAVVSRRYLENGTVPSDAPDLNRRAHRLFGRSFVLKEPVIGGAGRIRVDDTVWLVSGPDLPAGERVRVVGIEGTVLQVEPSASALKGLDSERRATPPA